MMLNTGRSIAAIRSQSSCRAHVHAMVGGITLKTCATQICVKTCWTHRVHMPIIRLAARPLPFIVALHAVGLHTCSHRHPHWLAHSPTMFSDRPLPWCLLLSEPQQQLGPEWSRPAQAWQHSIRQALNHLFAANHLQAGRLPAAGKHLQV
jgi:hypothetical protein